MSEWDFGFTFETVDDIPKEAEEKPKLQEILTKLESVSDLVESNRKLVIAEAHSKLQEVEALILPLLYNLRKNPEKEYIHWPNRMSVIDAQIEKILNVTRHYGER